MSTVGWNVLLIVDTFVVIRVEVIKSSVVAVNWVVILKIIGLPKTKGIDFIS